MQARQWRRQVGVLAAGALLAGPVIAGATAADAAVAAGVPDGGNLIAAAPSRAGSSARFSAAPAHGSQAGAARVTSIRLSAADGRIRTGRPAGQRARQPALPDAGFDGMLVAAIGTGLFGAGWLLMLVASRQLRRRYR